MIEQKCVVKNFLHAIHLMPKRMQSHASREKACMLNLNASEYVMHLDMEIGPLHGPH